MKTEVKNYNNAIELLNEFTNSDRSKYQDIISDKNISTALALLQDNSGILRSDYKLAKLCADCFMLGVFISLKDKNEITLTEQEQAVRCLKCEHLKPINGAFKCKLIKCKYD